eukprot:1214519-Pyramimonas_sp.AAC.1
MELRLAAPARRTCCPSSRILAVGVDPSHVHCHSLLGCRAAADVACALGLGVVVVGAVDLDGARWGQ